MNSDVYGQADVSQFAVFRDHGCGTGCGVSKLTACSYIQALSIKEVSPTSWRAIRALTYDLNQPIHNFKSHVSLPIFAWHPGFQVLKPSVNCHTAKGLIRKCGMDFRICCRCKRLAFTDHSTLLEWLSCACTVRTCRGRLRDGGWMSALIPAQFWKLPLHPHQSQLKCRPVLISACFLSPIAADDWFGETAREACRSAQIVKQNRLFSGNQHALAR